ncbi:phage tail protein [Photorhabdus namnaonensis]|uniref:Phage tail fiber repeat protein n=1 Tax=Photorhabdus namnaonensis TaxID=1851568 RepID=A0A1B8YLF2_9GAMM|nr:phage tail protein [Photorhabdus namnaonensis]OCA55992.1 Phage tail fiber repeat protein [Photorhabdus namnaonensis]
MSQKNDFKAFSISENANIMTQETYEKEQKLQTGFPAGDITAELLNKALRQSSTISTAVANFIATQSGEDVLDNGDIDKLTAQFKKALEQKNTTEIRDASLTEKGIIQLTDQIGNSNTLASTQKLVSDVNDNANNRLAKDQNGADIPDKAAFIKNLGLSDSTNITIGNGENQVPNMSFFTSSLNQVGWQKLPSGLIEMWGIASVKGNAYAEPGALNNFPIPFPNKCLNVTLTHVGNAPQHAGTFSIMMVNNAQFQCFSSIPNLQIPVAAFYRAVGY